VSDLDLKPTEYVCGSLDSRGPEELLITARKVWLGKTTQVARALPDAQLRMVGAWCFLDHYGPEDLSDSPGMRVWAHPHTGLQTVSWLLEGEIEHRDGLGSRALVQPGQLHIMTAGHGIVHSELSLADKPAMLHGVQLWVALPDRDRDTAPQFHSFTELPVLERPGVTGKVLIGELDGVRAPGRSYTPLSAADVELAPGASVVLAADPAFEYAVFVVAGQVRAQRTAAGVDQLVYLGQGREEIELGSDGGGRVIILGGEPFQEELVMWWNFVGRSHAEIVEFRTAWERRDPRFAPVVSRDEKVMEAPPLPTVQLKPRPRRRMP
jgi:redox-sensitive bicupin YhaK (pirin superfamily)